MTPYMLEIMLHHYCSRAEFPRASAPAYQKALDGLAAIHLLERVEFGFIQVTERGRAYLAMVLATPLPERGYYDPRNGQMVGNFASPTNGGT